MGAGDELKTFAYFALGPFGITGNLAVVFIA
jgi:hypothetical protein